MNRLSVCLASMLFVFFGPAQSQSYYFRHYQVENGLSNNAVVCSLQDRKGFLWFGTKDGLNRFDGYSFKVFRYHPDDTGSIGSNFIHSIYEDPHGMLWVGTETGLYKYDTLAENFSFLKGSANGQIRDIQMDSNNNLWFISAFTLFKYNESAKTLEHYPASQFSETTSITCSSDGILWVSTTSGQLKKYDARTNSFSSYDLFQHSPTAVSKWIEKIRGNTEGDILVGTSTQGAKIFHPGTATYRDILSYNPDHTGIFARNFIQTSANEYWIATETGVFIYNTQTGSSTNLQKTYNDPYSISDNAVYTFCKDKEGGIWSGTYFGGINYYPKQYTVFKKFFPKVGENSLSGNVVREIHEDQYGNLWIGTEDAGLNKFNPATGIFTHFKPTGKKGSVSYSNIHGLLVNGNELWVGTFEHGLDILNIKTGKVLRHYDMESSHDTLKSNFIYCLYKNRSGNILMGTTRGAYSFDARYNNFRLLPGLPSYEWYTSILEDELGVIWTSTYGSGVNYFNTHTGESGNFSYDPKNKKSLCSNRVNSIFEDSNHNLWFATEGGLCLFDYTAKKITRYTDNKFPSNFILSILEDSRKNLWISTSKGLVCFNPGTGRLNTYSRANGLLNDQFNFSSAYKDAKGNMYFGSVKGLISFNPESFTGNSFTSPVYITGFQVNNQDLSIAKDNSPLQKSIIYTSAITLKNTQSTFSIDFAALSYTAPETSEYVYKMEGLDKDWIYLKTNRKAYFTELAPGTYVFKVKASNSDGIWCDRETTLAIEILPPWWTSRWAYSAYFILLALGIYYISYNYHRRTEEKNKRKIERLKVAKEKEIFQAKIEFFTNVAHEIKTPLTLIKGPLEKVIKRSADIPDIQNNLKIMDRNTNRLIDLTNQLLDFRQTEIQGFSLNFVQSNITELIEECYTGFKPLAEQKNLSFTIDVPPAHLYGSVDPEAFTKILSNLMSNAIKYAESRAFLRLLPFSEYDQLFTIEISNDGYLIPTEMKEKIFEPFFRLKETEKQKGTGIGLALSRSLAELHKGTLKLNAPENNLNIFSLSLPVHQENEFSLHNM